MKLQKARFLDDPQGVLDYLARENIVPVKSPPWAKHPFMLRRNEKTKNRPSRTMTPLIMEALSIT